MKILHNVNKITDGYEIWKEIDLNGLNKGFKVGIHAAMKSEVDMIINVLKYYDEYKIDGMDFYTGSFLDKNANLIPIVIGISGPGKVNAALCVNHLIDAFEVKSVLNMGIAGSISDKFCVGDLAIIDMVVQSDIDTTAVGDEYGLVSRLNKVYFHTDKKLKDLLYDSAWKMPIPDKLQKSVIVGEQAFKEKMKAEYEALGDLSQFGYDSLCNQEQTMDLSYKYGVQDEGFVATNDSFIGTKEQREKILHHFPDAEICEMELGAVAQVCDIKEVPLMSVKYISDNADNDAAVSIGEVLKNASSVFMVLLQYALPFTHNELTRRALFEVK